MISNHPQPKRSKAKPSFGASATSHSNTWRRGCFWGLGPSGAVFFLCLFVLLFTGGCGGSGSSTSSPDVLTDAEWFGFRDGDGQWQEIQTPETQIFRFDDTTTGTYVTNSEGRYSLVALHAYASSQQVTILVLQSTVDESPELDISPFLSDDESADLEVTVSGLDYGYHANIFLADEETGMGMDGSTTLHIDPGTYDLVVTRSEVNAALPTHLFARHDMELQAEPTGDQSIEVSLDTADLIQLSDQYTISVDSVHTLDDGEVYLLTANGTMASLGYTNISSGDPKELYYKGLPFAFTSDVDWQEDLYIVELSLEPIEDSTIYYFQGFDTAGNLTVTPPGVFDGTLATDTSTGYLLPGLVANAYAGAIGYTVRYEASANGINYVTACYTTKGWLDELSEIEFFMPALHEADGWDTKWSIPETATTDWEAYVAVQAGSNDLTFANLIEWALIDTPRVDNGSWFASIANWFGGGSGEPL